MNSAIFYGVSLFFIQLTVGFLISLSTNDKDKGSARILKFHISYFIIGMVFTLGLTVTCIILIVMQQYLFLVVFLPLLLLTTIVLIAYFNCRWFYSNMSIVYRNFWRKKTIIRYEQIVCVECGLDIIIKTDNKRYCIYSYMVGKSRFLSFIADYIRPINAEDAIAENRPAIRSFNESVYRFGEAVFLIAMISIMGTGAILLGLYLYFWTTAQPLAWLMWVCGVQLLIISFLMVHAAKRAHSSAFWRAIADKLYKNNGNLRK